MKEKMEQLKEILFDETPLSKREVLLTVTATFLLGVLLGIFFSPRKRITIGSNNGNNSGNNNAGSISTDGEEEAEEAEQQ